MAPTGNPHLAHFVYFTLHDNSPAECERLADACRKYLFAHPGVAYCNVGTRAGDFTRDVNDLEFDVCLMVVFEDKAAHDAYQISEPHLEFVRECKANWDRVRVFDAYCPA